MSSTPSPVAFRFLGLTGGIASGKSTVSRMLTARGLSPIDADQIAREVVEPGTPGLKAIVDHFGADILNEDGTLDRAALGATVFSDPDARAWLNKTLHPLIGMRTGERTAELRAKGAPLVVYEAPLLVENNLHKGMDLLIVVSADPATQHSRVMARDGLDAEAAQARIDAQLPLADKIAAADAVIDNSGSLEDTQEQVERFLERLPERLWPDNPAEGRAALDTWTQAQTQDDAQ